MSCEVHGFEGREGGALRVSLTYDAKDARGKTTRNVDTYHGRFVRLIPNELGWRESLSRLAALLEGR